MPCLASPPRPWIIGRTRFSTGSTATTATDFFFSFSDQIRSGFALWLDAEVVELELPKPILLVEDDATIRMLIERALGKENLFEATDGLAGLDAVHRIRPEVIISDLDLPDLSGATFVAETRKTSIGACIPILLITPAGEEQRLVECFEEGADDFIVRPLSVTELKARVATLHIARAMAREAHPLTRLPAEPVIRARIAHRLTHEDPFAIAYVDINHFKTFNDARGFDIGDEVLKMLAGALLQIADSDREGIFVGHTGDDDFVVLLPPEHVDRFGSQIHARFEDGMRRFYTPRELEEESLEVVNRKAEVENVPLLSLTIAVATTERPGLDDVRKIAHVATELTRAAKAHPGTRVFVERRKNSPA
jgi:diguanylate cyclase (GGDEF)-like protein